MTVVKCDIAKCIYNEKKMCTAKRISITDFLEGEAECANFETLDDEDDDME